MNSKAKGNLSLKPRFYISWFADWTCLSTNYKQLKWNAEDHGVLTTTRTQAMHAQLCPEELHETAA